MRLYNFSKQQNKLWLYLITKYYIIIFNNNRTQLNKNDFLVSTIQMQFVILYNVMIPPVSVPGPQTLISWLSLAKERLER